jgi:predicted Zn-ribbon and HTH transcriptional regulator
MTNNIRTHDVEIGKIRSNLREAEVGIVVKARCENCRHVFRFRCDTPLRCSTLCPKCGAGVVLKRP